MTIEEIEMRKIIKEMLSDVGRCWRRFAPAFMKAAAENSARRSRSVF